MTSSTGPTDQFPGAWVHTAVLCSASSNIFYLMLLLSGWPQQVAMGNTVEPGWRHQHEGLPPRRARKGGGDRPKVGWAMVIRSQKLKLSCLALGWNVQFMCKQAWAIAGTVFWPSLPTPRLQSTSDVLWTCPTYF